MRAEDPISITKEIIKIGSKNGNENELAVFLKEIFSEMGFHTKLIKHTRNSSSLLAYTGKLQKMCINCHLDTVPYIKNDFKEDEKYIYGEGTVDTKKDIGPLIAALNSIREIPEGIVLAFDADEEYYNTGMKTIKGMVKAPYVIINEPTNLELHYGFKGWVDIDAIASSRQVHYSYAERDDAYSKLIIGLCKLLQKGFLKKDVCGKTGIVIQEFPKKEKDDAYIPEKVLCKMLITNNTNYNTKQAILRELKRFCPEFYFKINELWPAFVNSKSKLLREMFELSKLKTGIHKAWTNANFFVDRDVIIFGAGNPELCHTNKEHVSKKQLIIEKMAYEKLLTRVHTFP
jgi:acetylornithine deacetylase/succinyl-diaminopimelate desuccinylase-like protein